MSDLTNLPPDGGDSLGKDIVTPPDPNSELRAVISKLADRVDALTKVTDALQRTERPASATSTPRKLEEVEPMLSGRREALRGISGAQVLRKRRLIIPIHPPKISHLSSMFSSSSGIIDDSDIGLTFVATDREEREMFENYISLTGPKIPVPFEVVSAIEICSCLGFSQLAEILSSKSSSTINVKKVLSVYAALLGGADEVVCIDSDVVFTSDLKEVFARAAGNYDRSLFFAANSPTEITRDVVQACADFYSPEDAMRIRSIMGANLFAWFYDVPYYPASDAEAFLSHIAFCHGGIERALCRLTWHTFDHVLFINYLLLRGISQIVDITGIVGPELISDSLSLGDILSVRNHHDGYLPVWAPLSSMLSSPDLAKEAGFSIAMHVDRAGARISFNKYMPALDRP